MLYNPAQYIVHIHTYIHTYKHFFLESRSLTYYSSMLHGWVSCGTRFSISSLSARHLPQFADYTLLVRASGLLPTNGFLQAESAVVLLPSHPRFRHSSLTTMIPHYLRVTLSHTSISRSLLALSAIRNCAFSGIGFVILTSRSSLLINMFVFDILHFPSGCSQSCRCSASTCTTWLRAWARVFGEKNSFLLANKAMSALRNYL